MARPKSVPCVLKLKIDEIRNLPKLNKGTGGADPYVVIEIRDAAGGTLIGGERELNCVSCKTKTLKRVLEGYVLETFEFNINTVMIRSGATLKMTVMDFKPLPQLSRGIGFFELPLTTIAKSDGVLPKDGHTLLASGDIVTTFGKKIEHGHELRGYRDAKAPSVLHVEFEISTPEYSFVEGVPQKEQLTAWQFHLLEPDEQEDYLKQVLDRKEKLLAERLAAEESERKRIARERRQKRLKDLHRKLHEPKTARTNWLEFQDLIGNELMRREWGHTMDKYNGIGGWRRIAGTQVQEDRDYNHERLLIKQWLRYKTVEKEEETEVRDFATYFNTKRLREMTEHLREWSDFGGRYTAELNPGQRSLGASISRIINTAKTFPFAKDVGTAFDSGAAQDEEEDEGFTSAFCWRQGRAGGGDPVAYLAKEEPAETDGNPKQDPFVGFAEFKQALLHCLLSGDSRSVWRPDVESSLQHYLGELEVIETFEGLWMTAEQRQQLHELHAAVAGEALSEECEDGHRPARQKTPMISRINNAELVKSMEELVQEARSMTPPQDPQAYREWRSECSGKEKELDEARKALERETKLAAKPAANRRNSPERPQILQIPGSAAGPRQAGSAGASSHAQSDGGGPHRGFAAGSLLEPDSEHTQRRRIPQDEFAPLPSAPLGHAPQLEREPTPAARPSTEPPRKLTRGMSVSNLKRGKSVRFPAIELKPASPAGTDTDSGAVAFTDVPAAPTQEGQRSVSSPAGVLGSQDSRLRKRSRSKTPTAVMSSRGLRFYQEAPDADESKVWELEHCNGREYLFPRRVKTAQLAERLQRPTTQQVSRGVSAHDLTRERVFQTNTLDSVQPSSRVLRTSTDWHPYVPPSSTRWQHTEKLHGGRTYQELDLLPSLHSLSRGGRVDFGASILHPRPDTSCSAVSYPEELFHGHIEVAPDHPGGPSVHLEARYAKFGTRDAFESQLVNAIPSASADGALPGKELVVGHVALFDVPLKRFCLFNDLCVGCARKAQEAGARAAVFIQEDEELVTCEGGDDGILIPVLCVRRSDGRRLYNWIDPPRQFNPPYLRVMPWKPPTFAPEAMARSRSAPIHAEGSTVVEQDQATSEESSDGRATTAGAAHTPSPSEKLVAFWKSLLTEDGTGQDWLREVQDTISEHLKLPNLRALVERSSRSEIGAEVSEAASTEAQEHEAPAADRGEFQADKGTILKMDVTEHGVVELKKGVACIISSSSNIMPKANGESRDLPGYDDNIEALQKQLRMLGFKVLPPMRNKNADDVRALLRQVRQGFEKGGALSAHDSLVLIVTGHSDGQTVECSMDQSGQIGALGIQALMEFFSDLNAPGLKGKLKLFLLGMCLGNPVKEVRTLNHEAKYQRNVLNSIHTGGQASLVQCTSSRRATLKVKDEWLQDAEAVLRDEGDLLFANHVSLSFRQVPYSGTLWSRPNIMATGILVIDLGLFVEGMDTFAAFQLPTIDAKCTSMNVRYSKHRKADSPPSNFADWAEVVDDDGVSEFPLYEVDTGVGNPSGSVMKASRVFRVRPFSSRWLRIELSNDGSYGCLDGIGLRQLKLFCSPKSFRVPAHPIGKATWVENPAEGALGPALNRVGADSVWPQYVMPVYAFAGKPRALDNAIGLSADYTLLCYSVPVDGVSDVSQGSLLLHAFAQLLASAHHKHTLQTLLSQQLQHLLDRLCAELPGGYGEQVRLLQRRCDEDDFPIMLSLGESHTVSYGIAGPDTMEQDRLGTLRYRQYDKDVPEPRNADRNSSVFERVRRQVALPEKQFPASFHPRLHSPYFKLSHRNLVAAKRGVSDRGVTALAMQLSPSLKRVRWDIRVGGLEVIGKTALSVPHLRVGIVREKVIRAVPLDDYVIGEDEDSWAIQTGTLTVYRCHGKGSSPERVIGARFQIGDVVTVLLDLTNKTLAFSINDSDMVPPFSNVSGPMVPAVSAGRDTQVKLTIENCRTW